MRRALSILHSGLARSIQPRRQCPRYTSRHTSSLPSSTSTDLLPYTDLPFNAVEMNAEDLPVNDTSEFGARLFTTIQHIRGAKKNALYLKVNMLYSHYITVASMYGFKFHHAEGDYCSLLLWLPTDRQSVVPPFATHHVGVGALCVNSDNEILVVKERSKLVGWKLPGGYVNLGEELGAAACRETLEETGVRSTFRSVLSFRHSHDVQWGRGDMYIICRCEPHSRAITVDSEIADAQWMPLPAFEKDNTHPLLAKILEDLRTTGESAAFHETTMKSVVPGRAPFKFYSPGGK